jgi:hypothetical protein
VPIEKEEETSILRTDVVILRMVQLLFENINVIFFFAVMNIITDVGLI